MNWLAPQDVERYLAGLTRLRDRDKTVLPDGGLYELQQFVLALAGQKINNDRHLLRTSNEDCLCAGCTAVRVARLLKKALEGEK